jgi:hypothetical protein
MEIVMRHAIRTVALVVALLSSAVAQAQLFRAYLAPGGSDANPCTLAAPCRLLPAALTAVVSGGEIWMLDSANYNTGTVTVPKSVTILAVPGAVGSIVVTGGGPGILVAATGMRVVLRNLVIAPLAGAAPGTNGVNMTGNSFLHVDKSTIANTPGAGVRATAGDVMVTDSTIQGTFEYGVWVTNDVNATVASSRLLYNTTGGVLANTTVVAGALVDVSDCVISGGANGAAAQVAGSGTAVVSVTRSTISQMGNAIAANATSPGVAEVNIGSSMVVRNTSAWEQVGTGSAIMSLGNNQFRQNGAGFGTKSAFAGQ